MDRILIVVYSSALDFVRLLDDMLVRDKDSTYKVINFMCHPSAFIATMTTVNTIFQLSFNGEKDNIYSLDMSIMIVWCVQLITVYILLIFFL